MSLFLINDFRNSFKQQIFNLIMGKVISIIAIKGGVGKTTIASSLAADLVNHYGMRVLLIDCNY